MKKQTGTNKKQTTANINRFSVPRIPRSFTDGIQYTQKYIQ